MSAALTNTEPQAVAERKETQALTPMALLEKAITSGAGLDVIEKFMTLQERAAVELSGARLAAAALACATGVLLALTLFSSIHI